MESYTSILPILQTMASVICCGGASLLFLRGRNSRSRRTLAFIMMVWGLIYVVRVVGNFLECQLLDFDRIYSMDTIVLASGNLFLIFLFLYPLEIVRPGWLNLKRAVIIMLPYVAVTMLYFAGLYVLAQEPVELHDMRQFIGHIGEFNVWYRILMLLSIIAYLVILFRLTWHYEKFYRQWCSDNFSDDSHMDISWLRQYGIGVVLIGAAYFWLLFDGGPHCLVFHNIAVQCFFCYALYKGLFHDNPYSEDYFSHTLDEEEARLAAESLEKHSGSDNTCPRESEDAFLNRLPVYREEVDHWMRKKKPYLAPSFKLMDVSDILPLNRTYLSRIFNEGFGCSFSKVVRDYRIREAEYMLVNRADIPVGQVGELCGFSSPSAFHRAFVQTHDGLTPNRFRRQCSMKDSR